ncbi:MAG: radical SAM protein [Candidatus Gastranaerophilales bacterium]|nr:radical SAM protein [Candidatus Gastranaerophilales bacterium]
MLIDYSYIFDTVKNLYAQLSYNDKLGKAVLPIRYYLDITYNCNLRCPYCYLGADRKKEELTTQEWKDIIKQIPSYAFIALIGGEPLMREDFRELFLAASERTPKRVNLYTNSLLLKENLVDDFIKYKLLCLSVSLDGFGKKHDENRHFDGAFEKTADKLKMVKSKMKNQHKILIDIKTILLENNLEDLISLYEFCTENEFDFFSIALKRNNYLKQFPTLSKELSEEFYLQEYPFEPYFDLEKFKEVYTELLKISKHSKTKLRWAPKFKPDKDCIKQMEYLFKHGKDDVKDLYKPCLFPYSNIFINPEGNLYPCLSVNMGSLKEHSLKELINQPKYRCFRKNLKVSKIFNACQLCCEAYPKHKEE